MLKSKNIFFERCPHIEILFFMISNPNFSLFFSVIAGTVSCWKYHFPTILFPKSRNTVLKIFISCPPANTTPPYKLQENQILLKQNISYLSKKTYNCILTNFKIVSNHITKNVFDWYVVYSCWICRKVWTSLTFHVLPDKIRNIR